MNPIDELLAGWEAALSDLRTELYKLGDQAHTNSYNLLATEALRLSVCINGLRKALMEDKA
ncbi:hypothetical protein D3C75_1286660 [compost metagenome]